MTLENISHDELDDIAAIECMGWRCNKGDEVWSDTYGTVPYGTQDCVTEGMRIWQPSHSLDDAWRCVEAGDMPNVNIRHWLVQEVYEIVIDKIRVKAAHAAHALTIACIKTKRSKRRSETCEVCNWSNTNLWRYGGVLMCPGCTDKELASLRHQVSNLKPLIAGVPRNEYDSFKKCSCGKELAFLSLGDGSHCIELDTELVHILSTHKGMTKEEWHKKYF